MASIRNLKKGISYNISELIEVTYMLHAVQKTDPEKAEAIINELILLFDRYISKISKIKRSKNAKADFKKFYQEYMDSIDDVSKKIDEI